MSKRLAVFIIVLLFTISALCALSLRTSDEVHSFDSEPMLDKYFELSDDGDLAYWDEYEISLLTISQGGPLYSWFGHSAFLITTPRGRNIAFDYGTFSFSDDKFISNFIMGRLWFLCLSSSAEARYEELKEDGRSVSLVTLPFTAEQKKAIVNFMDANLERENREYLYHHYTDNCATRLRDIIDRATGGDFQRWAKAQDGMTFRQQASRALSRNRFAQWALEFLQSAKIDGKATLWDEMFLPDVLEKAVMQYYGLDSELVVDNGSRYRKVPEKSQSNMLFSILLGLVLGGISVGLSFVGKGIARGVYCGIVDIIFGILGSVLLFMMFFTNHDVTWFNENIIFANPLLILLGVLSFIPKENHRRLCMLCYRSSLFAILALSAFKLVFGSILYQQNWSAIMTFGFYFLANSVDWKHLKH
ncbi:MAG: DUF4105 domain-containing protein [Spirochaetales bacterium]|nr:DUF4105 domain-containing protein [Spirochaetales bacterium]